MARIAVVGCGYVGLGTGAVFADLGNRVVGVEINAKRVAPLRAGACPIFEPGLEELLARNLQAGRLAFTADYAAAIPEAEFVFICVNTPAGPHGGADRSHVRAAARSIGRHLAAGRRTVVVNKSTMPIGSDDLVGALLGEAAAPAAQFAVVANPEFLREGSAVRDMLHPDRVVLGSAEPAAAAYEAATGADAVALVTPWAEFKGLDLARVAGLMREPVLVDGRNLYDPRELAALGFTYRGVGLPAASGTITPRSRQASRPDVRMHRPRAITAAAPALVAERWPAIASPRRPPHAPA